MGNILVNFFLNLAEWLRRCHFKIFSWKILFIDVGALLFDAMEPFLQCWYKGIIWNVHVKLF